MPFTTLSLLPGLAEKRGSNALKSEVLDLIQNQSKTRAILF